MFRSEAMKLCQLYLQNESAYQCVSELGELGIVEFRDLNPNVNAFQRKFVTEVRRCDELERKLRFMLKEIEKADINIEDDMQNPPAPDPNELMDFEDKFGQLEKEMRESNTNYEQLQKSLLELVELRCILQKAQTFFQEAEHQLLYDPEEATAVDEELGLLAGDKDTAVSLGGRLGFVAGVIKRDSVVSFERLLWRACRGNVFFKHADIEEPLYDPTTGDLVHKEVFIIFFQGEQLKFRVKKICEGFRASLYPCPETAAERREMVIGVSTRIEDVRAVLNQTQNHCRRLLQTIAKNIRVWVIKVKKIKAIYHTMNLFNIDVTSKALIAECWAPVADLEVIENALEQGTRKSGNSVPSILNKMRTHQTPPTFNRTNKFTHGFQVIVDAYGVADYEEVNPALFTLITFPFLFSVMFGDLGHGLLMTLFAAWLVWAERKLALWKGGGEMFETIFAGRYIILLMGLFSMYAGLLYNDVFSKSLHIFHSGWVDLNSSISTYQVSTLETWVKEGSSSNLMFNPKDLTTRTPYVFGLDPIWQLASNKLTFTNSLKMKMSVVFGVTHMMFGVILSFFNHTHFKQPLRIWTEFLPQLLFIGCIFGYLVVIIIYKWIAFSIRDANQPSILLGIIDMFLKFTTGSIKEDSLLYTGQWFVQHLLVIIALVSVPWMLLTRPFILRYRHKHGIVSRPEYHRVNSDDEDGSHHTDEVSHNESSLNAVEEEEEPEAEFDFGEIFINQAIHTIEYCLSCISNTASYLRLWALSLAHAQLSEVLWNMVFKIGLQMSGYVGAIAIFLLFSAWAVLTIGILLLMEGLSAFLHTLRLHWVEFNSKFYHGTGIAFAPFSFKVILEESDS